MGINLIQVINLFNVMFFVLVGMCLKCNLDTNRTWAMKWKTAMDDDIIVGVGLLCISELSDNVITFESCCKAGFAC